jgi:hypothetical protein
MHAVLRFIVVRVVQALALLLVAGLFRILVGFVTSSPERVGGKGTYSACPAV